MPVDYGYIEGVINKEEKDNVDVIIFSSRLYKTGDKADVEIIGMLTRKDEDHKVIAVDDSVQIKSFNEISNKEKDLILEYFGFKSEIIFVDSKDKALEYLKNNITFSSY